MNVLIATTLNHNPGDDFIRMGCVNLFEDSFPGPHNYLYYNRNPDVMVTPPYSELRASVWGNYVTTLDVQLVDLVLIAGSPEWNGAPLKGLYTELTKWPNIPIIALGVGISRATPRLSPEEVAVLSSNRALVTTRSAGGARWFANQGVPGISEIPCPALFCGGPDTVGPQSHLRVILQKPGYGFQEVEPSLVTPELLARGPFTVFHRHEFEYYSKLVGKKYVTYTPDPAAALRAIASSKKVLSTRLHGAIAALSNDVPACILVKNDERINWTCELFPARILSRIASLTELSEVKWPKPHEIAAYRIDVRERYRRELSPFIGKL